MTNIEKIYRKLSKKYNIDYDEIKRICSYEFKFIYSRIKDDNDTKAILINKLLKFKCKTRFKNEINTTERRDN